MKRSLGKDPWKLIFSFSDSEKLLYVLKLPAGLLSRKNDDFLIFWTCPESKSMNFLKFGHFLKNGSPGQTTMLTRRAAKFCVEPRSPFSEISHQKSKTIGKPSNIVSWPECQPLEFPSTTHDWVRHDSRLQFQFLRLTTTTSQGRLINILGVHISLIAGYGHIIVKGALV